MVVLLGGAERNPSPRRLVIPQTLEGSDFCELARKWTLSQSLALALVQMDEHTRTYFGFGLKIISGHRSIQTQKLLKEQGRPAADPEVSTHTSCPATGADLFPTVMVTRVVKAQLGAAARYAGLRWGGGSPQDPETGIPSDWNHVDEGPRQ